MRYNICPLCKYKMELFPNNQRGCRNSFCSSGFTDWGDNDYYFVRAYEKGEVPLPTDFIIDTVMIDYSKCPFCDAKLLPGSDMPYNNFQCPRVECGSKYSNFDNWYFVFFVNGGIDIDNVAGGNVGVGDGSRSRFKLRVVVDFRDQVTTIGDVSVSLRSEIALHEVKRAYDLHNDEERECLMGIVRRVVDNMWMV